VRDASESDLVSVQAIYAHHVIHGRGSFELEPPSLEEIGRRHSVVQSAGLPYLVATDGKEVVGFAYAARYRPRPAYRYTAEDSVYVAPEAQGRGIGRQLLEELVRRCRAAGIRQMVAVIGDSANAASIQLHRALGFQDAGVLRRVGWKHERWLDTVFMQRDLAPSNERSSLGGERDALGQSQSRVGHDQEHPEPLTDDPR
jgi:phosphinothricin acetyltransferase